MKPSLPGRDRSRPRREISPRIEALDERVVPSLVAHGAEFRVNATTADNQISPAVAVDPDGDTVVAFQSGTSYNGPSPFDIKVQRYDSSGVAQGGEITVNTMLDDVQIQPAVAIDAAGDFVVAWSSYGQAPDGSGYGIFAQRFNAAGVKQGGEISVNTNKAGGQVLPAVAMDAAGNFVIAWTSGHGGTNDVYFQRYNAAGAPQGGETRANISADNSQSNSSLAMDDGGNFVIAWQSVEASTEVRFRRFAASGAPLDANDRFANASATGSQSNPSVAVGPTGGFIIAWDGSGPGDAAGIFFRRFNPSGMAEDVADVRTSSTTGASAPTVDINARGDFAIAWTNNDANGTGIFAQHFFPTGARSGPEFRVNVTTANAQSEPSLASDADGDLFVAWRSEGQSGDEQAGVSAQRFRTNLHPPTTTGISDVAVLEDAADTVINLANSFSDEDEGGSVLTYSIVSNSNPGLFTSTTINNANALRPLTLDYAPNASGSAAITIRATDTTGFIVETAFTVTVTGVNDAPTLDPIPDPPAILEDSGARTVDLGGISAGGGETQTLTVTATSSNPGLIPDPTVTYTSPNSIGSLSYTPVANRSGTAIITVIVTDSGGTANGGVNTFTRTFTIDVTVSNDPPTAVDDTASTDDQTPVIVNVRANDTDPDLPADALTVVAVGPPSPNVGSVTFTATGVTYTPAANFHGQVTFSYTVRDAAGAESTANVTVDVTDVTAPTVADLRVRFGTKTVSVLDFGRTLPWSTIDAILVVFSEDVSVVQADLALTGVNVPVYATSGFGYDPATRTATWSLPSPLGVDLLMLALDGRAAGAVQDASGNLLAGGVLGTLKVLPGDVTGDGVVDASDIALARNMLPGFGTPPTIFGDINGDGVVDINDYNLVRRRSGNRLPAGSAT
jgi:hypothetical protein